MKVKKDKDISIGLNCYTIRFRKLRDKDNYIPIKEAFSGKDFLTLSQAFVKTIDTKAFLNDVQNRILYLEKLLSANSSTITGIIRKGHNGQETYVDELKGAKANPISTIKKDQFNSIPFFFLLSQPEEGGNIMIFLAQSYRQYGFKEVFEEAFKAFAKENCPEILCEINTLSVPSLFNKLLDQGSIKKIRFKKHSLPKNLENILDSDKDEIDPENYEVEMSIRARKKGFMGIKHRLKSLDEQNTSFMEIIQIDNFEYDEAMADVTVSGRKRTLNMTRPSDFGASYDITSKSGVSKDTNHPDFSKVESEALNILNNDIVPNIKTA